MSEVSRVSINVKYSVPSSSSSEGIAEVEYLWGRIVAAVCLVLTLIGFVAWIFFNPQALSSTKQVFDSESTLSYSDMLVNLEEAVLPETDLQNMPTQEPVLTLVDVDDTIMAVPVLKTETLPAQQVADTNLLVEEPVHAVKALQEVVDTNTAEGKTIDKLASTNLAFDLPASVITEKTVSTPAKISILSPRIASAELSQNVEKRQAVDVLQQVIYVEKGQLLKVHFITDYRDLTGQWIRHEWYRGDVKMARVRLRPNKKEIRAISSKFIDQYMLGSWKVKVIDEANRLLAVGEFEVKAATP